MNCGEARRYSTDKRKQWFLIRKATPDQRRQSYESSTEQNQETGLRSRGRMHNRRSGKGIYYRY